MVDVYNFVEFCIVGLIGIDVEGLDSGKYDVDLIIIVYLLLLKDNWCGFVGFGYVDG